MAVRTWGPFRDLLSIQNEMNRLFANPYGPGAAAEAGAELSWTPALDIYETADRDSAGAQPKRIEVRPTRLGGEG
ncbi:MAG: hypothetical protein ACRDJU_01770 [Actinomycetota bacterium]